MLRLLTNLLPFISVLVVSGLFLSGCDMGSGVRCSPWGCWTDLDSLSYDDKDYPTFDEPTFVPPLTSPTAFSTWRVPFTDETAQSAPKGLLLKNTSGTFVRKQNADGGFLLIEIDAETAALSCETTLVAKVDDEILTTDVIPIADSSAFMAESLGTGCLSSNESEGTASGFAIFELDRRPETVVLTELKAVSPESLPSNTVSIGGRQVSVRIVPYQKILNVTIDSLEADESSNQPLQLEGFVTSPYYHGINDIYEKLDINPEVLNFKRDRETRRITYDLAVINSDVLKFGIFLKLNLTSARDLESFQEELE